jgi:transposase
MGMAAIPTLTEEDAKRPGRERENLVGERTRIINRIKGALARLGIRNFKPTLRNASQLLQTLHTAEGVALPPNTLAELRRDMARLSFGAAGGDVIKLTHRAIQDSRCSRPEQIPEARRAGHLRLPR